MAYYYEGRARMSPDVALAISYIVMIMALFLVACRWFYHIKRYNKYGIMSEIWMVVGVLALIGLQVCITMLFKDNNFLYDLSNSSSWIVERLEYAAAMIYGVGIFFVKLAVAHHFLNISQGKKRWMSIGLIVLLVGAAMGSIIVNALRGGDSTKVWSEDLDLGYGGGTSSYANAYISIIVTYALHIVTYLCIFLNYFLLVRQFQPRNRNEKISVYVAWFFAFLIVVFSTWRFASAFVRKDIIALYYWSSYEFSLATMYAAHVSIGGPLFGVEPAVRPGRRRKNEDHLIEDGVAQ